MDALTTDSFTAPTVSKYTAPLYKLNQAWTHASLFGAELPAGTIFSDGTKAYLTSSGVDLDALTTDSATAPTASKYPSALYIVIS